MNIDQRVYTGAAENPPARIVVPHVDWSWDMDWSDPDEVDVQLNDATYMPPDQATDDQLARALEFRRWCAMEALVDIKFLEIALGTTA